MKEYTPSQVFTEYQAEVHRLVTTTRGEDLCTALQALDIHFDINTQMYRHRVAESHPNTRCLHKKRVSLGCDGKRD